MLRPWSIRRRWRSTGASRRQYWRLLGMNKSRSDHVDAGGRRTSTPSADANVRVRGSACQAAGRVLLQRGAGRSRCAAASVRLAGRGFPDPRLHPPGRASKAATGSADQAAGGRMGGISRSRAHGSAALAPHGLSLRIDGLMYADDERGRAARGGVMSRIPLGRFAEPEDFVVH